MGNRRWAAFCAVAAACGLCAGAAAQDRQHTHLHEGGHVHRGTGPHGGVQAVAGDFEAEVVFHADAIDVYLRDPGHHHVEARGLSGDVRVSFEDPSRSVVEAALTYQEGAEEAHVHHEAGEHGHEEVSHGRLTGRLDLSQVGEGEVNVEVRFRGLPSDPNAETGFSVPFRIARSAGLACDSCGSIDERDGPCRRCGEALAECWTYFACPMHPEVGSEKESDTCWKCGGMRLVLMRDEELDEAEEEHEGHEHHHDH